jgi:phenylalanyl-tRNA synthetase alpha chain
VEHYPYTDPSLEMEIMWDARWVEILGAGIVHPDVLRNLGFDPSEFNAWAFGFGVDRLAMIKMKIPDIRLLRSNDERVVRQLEDLNRTFQPVSKYPAVVRDISFVVARSVFDPNLYYESVREVIGSDDIEEVKLLDTYSDEARFGPGTQSYTFRITYRRFDRTMTNEEANELHERLRRSTTEDFSASLR